MRRRDHDEGSLELLLDTMCNAFGGIMFIAILVMLLSQMAEVRRNATSPMQADELKLKNERDSLLREHAQLSDAARQQDEIENAIRDNPRKDLAEQLIAQRQANADLARQLDDARKGQSDAQHRQEQAESAVRRAQQRIEELNRRAAESARKAESTASQRVLRLPRRREANTLPLWIIVKNNRLFLVTDPATGDINSAHVTAEEGLRHVSITPRAGGGIPVSGAWSSHSGIQAIYAEAPPSTRNLQFAVYPDSFGAFINVRDTMVSRGYEYDWVPMSDIDRALVLGPGRVSVQ